MSPNEGNGVVQIGGTHYESKYQHWDWVADTHMDYFSACATKYVSRWWKKNGVQDLLKARSYVEKLIEKFETVSVLFQEPAPNLDELNSRFILSNKLPRMEAEFCVSMTLFSNIRHLQESMKILDQLVELANCMDEPTLQATPQAPQAVAAPALAPQGQSPALPRATGAAHGAAGQAPPTSGPTAEQVSRSRGLVGLEHPFGYDEDRDS